MFGETLDYHLLRPLTHERKRATEEELDERRCYVRPEDYEAAVPKLRRLVARLQGRLPVDPKLRYLDMGCGSGELALALVRIGARSVTGVDFVARRIHAAREYAEKFGMGAHARFECADLRTWRPKESFDVLLSHNAFEHIDDPARFLRTMTRFVAPGGMAVISFGPLFHSPFGDHMWDFFRVQIPWRGVLFSEKAILRLRRECFRPTDPARRLCEITGGLNQMRLSEFMRYVYEAGWRFDYLAVNPQAARIPGLKRVSDALARTRAGDYIAHCVDAVLRRAEER